MIVQAGTWRMAIAVSAAVLVILSAPFAQQAFTLVANRWPGQLRTIGVAATAVPAGIALLFAFAIIRERRVVRYLLLAGAAVVAGGYIVTSSLSFAESFHFVEYGLLGLLFYHAVRPAEDGSAIALPILAGVIAGTADEWFQWFIPIRAGEARDVLLNAVAASCGLMVALAVDPPDRFTLRLEPQSRRRVVRWSAAAVIGFAVFFRTVHVGYEVHDPEIGSFLSRFTAAELARAAEDRADRWKDRPPVVQRWIAREDQYLSEGLWHVQRRNRAWQAGDIQAAWRENRILELFYAPVLDTASYAGADGHRWPADQREDAAARGGAFQPPRAGREYPYPLYVWPGGRE